MFGCFPPSLPAPGSLAPRRSCWRTAAARLPLAPEVTNAEDTSNFDEVEDEEPEKPADKPKAKGPTGFQGEELPFVGYSYTRPFLNHVLVPQPRGSVAALAASTGGLPLAAIAEGAAATASTDSGMRDAARQLNEVRLQLDAAKADAARLKTERAQLDTVRFLSSPPALARFVPAVSLR